MGPHTASYAIDSFWCALLCGAAVVEVDPTPALEHHLHLLQYVILCVATADDILPEREELLPPVRSENQQEAQPLAPVAREPLSESPLSPHLSQCENAHQQHRLSWKGGYPMGVVQARGGTGGQGCVGKAAAARHNSSHANPFANH